VTQMLDRELDEPLDPIAEAEADVERADDLIAELEERVVDGDGTVTAEDLEQARGLKRLALLRRQGAEKRAQETAEHLRAAQVEQLREDLATFRAQAEATPLHTAYAEAVRALAELRRQADATAKQRAALESRAASLDVPAGGLPRLTVKTAVEWALTEAEKGQPPLVDGRALPHPLLHDPQRATQMREQDEQRQERAERQTAERVAERDRRDHEARVRRSQPQTHPGMT
jgi:hypothetical protein